MAKYLNLNQLRSAHGLKQTDLSAMINTTQGYISELEKGKKPITEEIMSKLRSSFGDEELEKYMEEAPTVQQTVEGEVNNFSGTGNVTVQEGSSIPLEAFNKILAEIAEQRKLVSKSQEQIDRLLSLLEDK